LISSKHCQIDVSLALTNMWLNAWLQKERSDTLKLWTEAQLLLIQITLTPAGLYLGPGVYAGPSFYQSVSKSSILWQVSTALTDRGDILNIWHFYWAACKLCFHSSLARLLT